LISLVRIICSGDEGRGLEAADGKNGQEAYGIKYN